MIQTTSLRARDLSKIFNVYGRFYRILLGGVEVGCRSVLELIDQSVTPNNELSAVNDHSPDLHVVMMNPGSSRPLSADTPIPLILDPATIPAIQLVPTRPDNTQYQIMKIMVAKGYRHARVVNLSDIREPKSPRFLEIVERLRGVSGGALHSLFCDARSRERGQLLQSNPSIPVIVGWGRHPGLKPLAEQCLQRLTNRILVGDPVKGESTLFAHPSPMLQSKKDEWIAKMLQQMDSPPPGN